MLLCADAAAAFAGLAGGLLGLPVVRHRAAGAAGHGAERVIRLLDGAMARLRPDRSRCRSCKCTHILLPAWCAPRRADAIEVIGTLTRPHATPRTWWPTLPCGPSRPRSPALWPSQSGRHSPRAGRPAAAGAALGALLWPGLVRVTVLQHVTWSVNSPCHVIGTRPFTTHRHDQATNLWPLAGQAAISAAVIRIFERLGWAIGVHWPAPARLESRRRVQGRRDQGQRRHSSRRRHS
ncbi:MAG TPA: hypothetical protein VHS32_12385, partial [Streptosporangiaceae bacterium]|nr:hypothetical protein [Streptosporangiaceae bacterium]